MSSREITANTTLVVSDAELELRLNSSAARTITIPSGIFADGDRIYARRISSGNVTFEGDTGVTVNGVSGGSVTTSKFYQLLYAEQTAADTWTVTGDEVSSVEVDSAENYDQGSTVLDSGYAVDYGNLSITVKSGKITLPDYVPPTTNPRVTQVIIIG
jgi:hypothetical protein